ncbi:pyrimidine/purine nucleoside phosphorylase [Sulfurimonas sp. SAG-AH-194-I05]|nr:pyrimidine/purine nucleoside phosphorylase [Sulfurimonas sp. SAG-AH-194-I05]MDF1875295.1 pyrimidine/purine nucleoside phosphorylase [Sulfurimonas sp. SAG-AH-194-I05]
MTTLDNVSIVKAANIYYDGKVTSRTIHLADGTSQSLGIMLPGEYTFSTNEAEIMEMLSGTLEIKLPGEEWKTLRTPETFNVEANASFDLKIKTVTDYCCSYIQA